MKRNTYQIMMHKETVEMTVWSPMFKATLSFENNKTIFIDIIETKESQNNNNMQ